MELWALHASAAWSVQSVQYAVCDVHVPLGLWATQPWLLQRGTCAACVIVCMATILVCCARRYFIPVVAATHHCCGVYVCFF